jgi:hypothetical protein
MFLCDLLKLALPVNIRDMSIFHLTPIANEAGIRLPIAQNDKEDSGIS